MHKTRKESAGIFKVMNYSYTCWVEFRSSLVVVRNTQLSGNTTLSRPSCLRHSSWQHGLIQTSYAFVCDSLYGWLSGETYDPLRHFSLEEKGSCS